MGARPPFVLLDMTTKTQTVSELWDLLEPYLAAEHLELDDLELVGAGRTTTLRLVLDAPEGIDLDRITVVSRNVSRLLDAEAALAGPYQLEVSSPGLERWLRRPSHFQKSVGREASVKVAGEESTVTLRGKIVESGEDALVLEVAGERRKIGFGEIVSAKTVFSWDKPGRPGHKDSR